MKISEVKELNDKELSERVENEKGLLVQLKINHTISPLDNPLKIKEARKNIARLLTEQTRRMLNKETKS